MNTVPLLPEISLRKKRAVSRWLMIGVFMLVVQILLGGVTRLTGSGLSITDWKPLHGIVPPLTEASWQEEFSNYQLKASGQFQQQNANFSLSDFKHIFFWEWLHRAWARLMGLVFLVGFVYFLVRKFFDKEMIAPFVILFILGALQGAIGWIMVQSGLNPDDTHVDHIRLTTHFMAAMALIVYTYWFSLKLRINSGQTFSAPSLHGWSISVLILGLLQMTWGGFMAGLKAAQYAPTWPSINGEMMPTNLTLLGGRVFTGFDQFVSNPIGVHLVHRTLAYLLLLAIIGWTLAARKVALRNASPLFRRWYFTPLVLSLLQVFLGIATVLTSPDAQGMAFGPFEWMAQLHQLTGTCLILSLVFQIYLLRPRQAALQ